MTPRTPSGVVDSGVVDSGVVAEAALSTMPAVDMEAHAAAAAAQPAAAGGDEPAGTDGRIRTVELTEPERELFGRAVDRWSLDVTAGHGTAPGSAKFFDAAEIAEGTLPTRVRAAFTALRWAAVDAVVVRGLPADRPAKGARPTPAAALRGHAWTAMAVRRLGHEFAYASEMNGSIVHDIRPTREGATTQSNASWRVDLHLHTEIAFHALRPSFVVLYCVRAPQEPPATRLAPVDDVLPHLTDQEIAMLGERRFTVNITDSFRLAGETEVNVPMRVLGGSARRPTIRWHESIRGTDAAAERLCRTFVTAADRVTREVRLRPGDLLAFANDRCLHGRDRFDASLDGDDRWLLRAYVTPDPARTRRYTTADRPSVVRLDLATVTEG